MHADALRCRGARRGERLSDGVANESTAIVRDFCDQRPTHFSVVSGWSSTCSESSVDN